MKLKALAIALFVAGLLASIALADPGKGRGNGQKNRDAAAPADDGHEKSGTTSTGTTTTEHHGDDKGCRKVEVKGTLVSVAGTSFTITVTRGNDAAAALVGKPATFAVDAKTRVSWSGVGTLTGPNAGDVVGVVACSTAAAGTIAPATLTAARVEARAPAASGEKHK